MKKIFQLFLIFLLISSVIIFYYKFFSDKEDIVAQDNNEIETTSSDETTKETINNIIKNLNYQIKIEDDNEYRIFSDLSEISYKGGIEFVLMQKVKAFLEDKDGRIILISSDKASYNNDNHNTIFENNVKISYLDNIIQAEKMNLNFEDNYILISENIDYSGSAGILKADNIKMNLITKKITISMNNNNENIVISSSK